MKIPKRLEAKREEVKSWHGCYSGDCPHEKQEECLDELFSVGVQALLERQELKGLVKWSESVCRNEALWRYGDFKQAITAWQEFVGGE